MICIEPSAARVFQQLQCYIQKINKSRAKKESEKETAMKAGVRNIEAIQHPLSFRKSEWTDKGRLKRAWKADSRHAANACSAIQKLIIH